MKKNHYISAVPEQIVHYTTYALHTAVILYRCVGRKIYNINDIV